MGKEMDLNLEDRAKIDWILRSIVTSQQPVTLEFTDSKYTAKCLLYSIDSCSGYIKLGGVSPLEANTRIAGSSVFSLTTNVNGVQVLIRQLTAESVIAQDGTEVFNVKIPPMVYYSQRRDVFRAQVNEFMDLPVIIHAANTFPSDHVEPLTAGKILDISVEGCAVRVSGLDQTRILNHNLLTVLELSLPDATDFPTLFAELIHSQLISEQNITMLGFSFTGNSKSTRKELGLLVTRIQLLARETTTLRA